MTRQLQGPVGRPGEAPGAAFLGAVALGAHPAGGRVTPGQGASLLCARHLARP